MGNQVVFVSSGLPFLRPSTSQKVGKLHRRPLKTVGRLSSVYHLDARKCYYVQDLRNGRQYLVDTGAEFSILPASFEDKRRLPPLENLEAANGSLVHVYGRRNTTLNFGQGKTYTHTFLLADVTKPLLGVDFFNSNNIGIDTKGRRMYDISSGDWFGGGSSASSGKTICPVESFGDRDSFGSILDEFPEITSPTFTNKRVLHGISHYVPTSCLPIRSRPRRLDDQKLACAKAEFQKLLDAGIIRRSSSPWSSPLHCVPKPNGEWRPCGDYRRLNEATEHDTYQLPLISDFTAQLKGCTVFSKVDLAKAYHQIPMHPDHVAKTAIVTPFGTFEFLRMPFGLKSSAQAFQRLMDSIFGSLPYVFVYLDDLLIASRSDKEHKQHLRNIFGLLRDNGLFINKSKCLLGVHSLTSSDTRLTRLAWPQCHSGLTPSFLFLRPPRRNSSRAFLG